jgi:hypothetical protein
MPERSHPPCPPETPISVWGSDLGTSDGWIVAARAATFHALPEWMQLDQATIDGLVRWTARETDIAALSGRWVIGQPDPNEYLPGDVVALRSIIARANLRRSLNDGRGLPQTFSQLGISSASCLKLAKPYFIPAEAVDAILSADAPDDTVAERIELPAPVVSVWLGSPLQIDGFMSIGVPEEIQSTIDRANVLAKRLGLKGESIEEATYRRSGQMTGVVLFRGPSGRICDEVAWIASAAPNATAPGPMALDRIHGLIFGWTSRSVLGPFARVLAATVSWGGWKPPAEPLKADKVGGGDLHRLAKTGAWKRREPAGALGAVRVLDVAATTPAVHSPVAGRQVLDRLSPIPHWRRPHIRRVRVGPRTSWHYEERSIEGTNVEPHGPVRSGDVVWRIPASRI